MDTETIYFQEGEITVTNARFVVGSQTFAMRGITSVQGVENAPSYKGPGAAIVLGVILAMTGFGLSVSVGLGAFGILLIALGVWLFSLLKPTFAVVLRTAGGDVTAYQSKDREFIWEVIQALTDSIVARG